MEVQSHWLWYVCGTKGIFYGICEDKHAWDNGDFQLLLSWTHYHNAMAHFSLRHWRGHRAFEEDYSAGGDNFMGLLPGVCGVGLAEVCFITV